MTLLVTEHNTGQMRQQSVEVAGPVVAAEAVLKAGVEMAGRALSVLGAPITAKTLIEQPETEIEVHDYPVFG